MSKRPDDLPLPFEMSADDVELSALYRREYAASGDADEAAKRVEEHCRRVNILREARAL